MSKKRRADRINMRLREDDVEIKEYIDTRHSSVSLSDIARQSMLYCIRHQVLTFPDKAGYTPQRPVPGTVPTPVPASPKDVKLEDQVTTDSHSEEADDFSSLLDSLDI